MNIYFDDQDTEKRNYASALEDFRRARSRAFLQELVARIKGESVELLSYEEVRQKLRAYASSERGLQDIPLDAIVGSVGRYQDFTRDFLPRSDTDKSRWARVMAASDTAAGLPPIDVYKIGDVYFVQDGNHRVSVARQLGATTIQAFVTEVQTRVPLSPDTRPDDLIVKAEYAEFLESTHLDELRPEADLSVTVPGNYPILEEHISVHRYYLGIEQMRYIPDDEAVTHWFDHIYLPAVQAIREAGILHYFPNRTETDLYLWIAQHRASLEQEWGTEIKTEVAALDLLKQEAQGTDSKIGRIGGKILQVIAPGILEGGPPPGQWREEASIIHHDDSLFTDILVPVNGEATGWYALDQALVIARRDGARLHGLHVVDEEDLQSEAALMVQSEFMRRCQEQGQQGHLLITSGEIPRQISIQSRLTDLVVTTLLYPPPPRLLARIDSGFRDLIQRCPRPVLAVPQVVSPLDHALLAYDGSPKSDEALFVATYLAGRWQIPLTVTTVFDQSRVAPETLLRAQVYLDECGIQADYAAISSGPVAEAILKTAEERQADVIIMGGYGFNPVIGMILGSAVDQVLRESRKPVLICR